MLDCSQCAILEITEMVVINIVIAIVIFAGGLVLGHAMAPPGIEGRLSDRAVVGVIHNRHRWRLREIREKFNELHPLDTTADYVKEQADERKEEEKFKKFAASVKEYYGVDVL